MIPRAPVPHLTVRAKHWRPATRLGRALTSIAAAFLVPLLAIAGVGLALASSASLVGVSVRTAVRSGPPPRFGTLTGTYFLVGQAERGDTVAPIRLNSWADYLRLCGNRVTYGYAYDDVRTYFRTAGEAASPVYFARVAGPAATVGTRMLVDRAGAPLNTLRIDAVNPGAWSAGLTVQVEDGTLANTFRLTFRFAGYVDEVFDNLATPAAAVAALTRSQWVRGTDMASATAAPNNRPAVLAASALSAGADDRAAIVGATYTAALARFGPQLGAGAVAIPGIGQAITGAALIAHAAANRRTALLADLAGTTRATSMGNARNLTATYSGDPVNAPGGAERAALLWPWVRIEDGPGQTRLISPEGYAAGCRAKAFALEGPWRSPAGDVAVSPAVIGTEFPVTQAELVQADDAAVSVIIDGPPPRLYGWNSLSSDRDNWALLTNAEVLNLYVVLTEDRLEQYVHNTVDGKRQKLSRIEGTLRGIAQEIADAGGLFALFDAEGTQVDPGYSVNVGPEINPVGQLAANLVKTESVLRVSPTAKAIDNLVTKAALTAPV